MHEVLRSTHDALDSRTSGLRNFPVFLRECLEKRVWEQERRFPSGKMCQPMSFHDFIHNDFPVGLGTSYEAIERIIGGDQDLESLWGMVTGRAVVPHTPETLPELERVIGDGLRTFVEVGRALAKIRDDGMYKEAGFKTFPEYCRARWQMERAHAYRLIEAAGVAENVSNWRQPESPPPPMREAQARELAKLPAEEQAPAWEEAVRTAPDGKVTARHVAEVVAARAPEREPHAREILDAAGYTSAPTNVVHLGPVDRAMGLIRNMSEGDVYEFKKRFNEYLRDRAKVGG